MYQCRGLTPASAALRLPLQVPRGASGALHRQLPGAEAAQTSQALGRGAGAGGTERAQTGAAGFRVTHRTSSWRTPSPHAGGADLEHSAWALGRVSLLVPQHTSLRSQPSKDVNVTLG